MERLRIILIMTEWNLVCYEYNPSIEEPFFVNDTKREFFVQAIFVLYPCGRWFYETYKLAPYLHGVCIGIEHYRPVFAVRGKKSVLRPLSETVKKHNGFVIPLSDALALIEGKRSPVWREEENLVVVRTSENSAVAIPARILKLLQKVPEIRSVLSRAAECKVEA